MTQHFLGMKDAQIQMQALLDPMNTAGSTKDRSRSSPKHKFKSKITLQRNGLKFWVEWKYLLEIN